MAYLQLYPFTTLLTFLRITVPSPESLVFQQQDFVTPYRSFDKSEFARLVPRRHHVGAFPIPGDHRSHFVVVVSGGPQGASGRP